LLILYTDTERHNTQRYRRSDRETDRRYYDDKSWSAENCGILEFCTFSRAGLLSLQIRSCFEPYVGRSLQLSLWHEKPVRLGSSFRQYRTKPYTLDRREYFL